MQHLMEEVARHLNRDVLMQLTQQLGAQDPNEVAKAAQGASELLLQAIASNANNQQRGGGLFGAIEKDHDGGILGNLMGIFTGKQKANNPSTTNGEGIVRHLFGDKQLKAAQMIAQMSGLDFFKSGVLLQLLAPVVMGVVGQSRKSKGLDLGGLAKVLLGGGAGGGQQRSSGGGLGRLLDMDGDGSAMDDLINIGMKILKK